MRAFRLEETTEGPQGRLVDLDQAALTEGDTLLRTHYAGINYKDALAGTGRALIARMLPLNAGIEAVAEVVESADPALGPGTMVIAHGMGLGVDRDGGWRTHSAPMRSGWCGCRKASTRAKQRRSVSRATLPPWLSTGWNSMVCSPGPGRLP
ncbi:hypothetical protein GTA62_20020 [Roseobacter sp. HKCCD9010]|uniref:alcohol dehydrogenase catalytic domain-containing protein n=1 Tax=unclassified Roseobacter TaxID=196798 RepID=UPI001492E2C2|nr:MULTISPECIES: hypothetical protein [unclassified Roseobacter]MBF9052293.1 hypothetical protein [Rhodobacterales bacterium HKCCD4356]NNV14260.1 hypothetical protein [Roseobacter sp. HKCCD7357]NNV18453.1 hypothetical protein [Roseobacter sp. HKCCD8768]NNV27893.1 hypothetical protein [Roseobacter sp. HKCCD8192]NNV32185.1 hypothetical protein [Roseobacter sp. HKCCD9061]